MSATVPENGHRREAERLVSLVNSKVHRPDPIICAQVEALLALEAQLARIGNALVAVAHVAGGESLQKMELRGLLPGDLRLLDDVNRVDDRGLELAEAFLHERRQSDTQRNATDLRVQRAIEALSRVRDLTKTAP